MYDVTLLVKLLNGPRPRGHSSKQFFVPVSEDAIMEEFPSPSLILLAGRFAMAAAVDSPIRISLPSGLLMSEWMSSGLGSLCLSGGGMEDLLTFVGVYPGLSRSRAVNERVSSKPR